MSRNSSDYNELFQVLDFIFAVYNFNKLLNTQPQRIKPCENFTFDIIQLFGLVSYIISSSVRVISQAKSNSIMPTNMLLHYRFRKEYRVTIY